MHEPKQSNTVPLLKYHTLKKKKVLLKRSFTQFSGMNDAEV